MNIKIRKNIAERLTELIDTNSITAIAKKTNIPQPTLSRYINQERDICVEYLIKLADYFNVTTDFLLGRTDY